MRSMTWGLAAMALLLAVDQASKLWVRATIPLYQSTVLIPNFIDLTHVKNPGVSFSFLATLPSVWRVPLLAGISLAAALLLLWYWLRHRAAMNGLTEWAFLLILPGAVGNLIDRAGFGVVTDFFHFRIFSFSLFVNNIADIFISAGVGCYLAGLLLARRRERHPVPSPRSGQAPSPSPQTARGRGKAKAG